MPGFVPRRRLRGLTLIELGAVVVVLAVVLAIAIPFFLRQREDAYNKRAISTLRNAISAARGEAAKNQDLYPEDLKAALEATETSFEFKEGDNDPSTDFDEVSVLRAGDMAVVMAAYVPQTETCWFVSHWHSSGDRLDEIDDTLRYEPVEMPTPDDPDVGPCAAANAPDSLVPPGADTSVPGDGEEDGEAGDADDDGPEADPVLNPACHYDPTCFVADSWGDPHIVTFDGLGYEFMSVGEFTFVESSVPGDPHPVNIQIRTVKLTDLRPEALDWVSITTGVAAEVGGHVVTFTKPEGLRVDQVDVPLESGEVYPLSGHPDDLHSEGYVARTGNLYRIVFPGDADLMVSRPGIDVKNNSAHINVKVYLPTDYGEAANGVAGYPDQNPFNDLRVAGSDPLPIPTSNHIIHTTLASSWLVTSQDSLFVANGFDYSPFNASFPSRFVDDPTPPKPFADVDPAALETARSFCESNGVHPNHLSACVLDFLAADGDQAQEEDAISSALEATIPSVINAYDDWDHILTFEDGQEPSAAGWGAQNSSGYGTAIAMGIQDGAYYFSDSAHTTSGSQYRRWRRQDVVGDYFTFQADVKTGTALNGATYNSDMGGIRISDGTSMYWVRVYPTHVVDGNVALGTREKTFVTNTVDRFAQIRITKTPTGATLFVDGHEAFPLTPAAPTGNEISFGFQPSSSTGSGMIMFDNVAYSNEDRRADNMLIWAANPWAQTLYFSDELAPMEHGWRQSNNNGYSTGIGASPLENGWALDDTVSATSGAQHRRYYLPYTVPEEFTFETAVRATSSSNGAAYSVHNAGIRVSDGVNEYTVRIYPTHVADGNVTAGTPSATFSTNLSTRSGYLRISKTADKAELYVDGQFAFELQPVASTPANNGVTFGFIDGGQGAGRLIFDDVSLVGTARGGDKMVTWAPDPWVLTLDFEDGVAPIHYGWTAATSSSISSVGESGTWVFDDTNSASHQYRYTLQHAVTASYTVEAAVKATSTSAGQPFTAVNGGLELSDGTNMYRVRVTPTAVFDGNASPLASAKVFSTDLHSRFAQVRISKTPTGATLYVDGEKAFDLTSAPAGGDNHVHFGFVGSGSGTGRLIFDRVSITSSSLGAAHMSPFSPSPWAHVVDFSDGQMPMLHNWAESNENGYGTSIAAVVSDGALFLNDEDPNWGQYRRYRIANTVSDQFTFEADVTATVTDSSKSFTTRGAGLRIADGSNMYWVRVFPDRVEDGNGSASYPTDLASGFATLRITKDGSVVKAFVNGQHVFDLTPSASSNNEVLFGFIDSTSATGRLGFDNIRLAPSVVAD